jgi:hypothetical protein
MAQYRQVKRNGRWVTINTKTGKEVGVGEGYLGEVAKKIGNELSYAGKNFVYSDKTDDKGRPLTIAQAEDKQTKPKPKVAVKPTVKPKVKAKPTPTKTQPAEVQPTKPTVRAAQQSTTVQKPAAKTAPKPADKPKPMTQMGDVRGAKFEGGPSANEKLTIGKTRYEGESLTGVKSDGSDVERRRAFLDAEDSRKGIKAVRDLLEKRKKEKKFSR